MRSDHANNAATESGLDEIASNWLESHKLRSPGIVMQPDRLAACQPSRISASRAFIGQMVREKWKFTCAKFSINSKGVGEALYHIEAPNGWNFSLPIYSFEPSTEGRTFRIIGTSWDMMGALIEGRISDEDFETTRRELPKLYRGRATSGTLTWFRANRSARVFDDCVEALSKGNQPDSEMLWNAGYTMRNTGLDGNGTFGTKTFTAFEPDHPLRWALSAQMLSAYMMRVFALDLMDDLAKQIGGDAAVKLDPEMARYLGVGNGSALGLMFFVNNRPKLVNQWLEIRENCIAQAKNIDLHSNPSALESLIKLCARAKTFRQEDASPYGRYPASSSVAKDLDGIHAELIRLNERLAAGTCPDKKPLEAFCKSVEGRYGAHAVETLMSILIELVPDYADAQMSKLVVDEEIVGEPEMTVGYLLKVLNAEYSWVFEMDLTAPESMHYIWYKSRNAEEPRRGPRKDIDDKHELGLDLPRLIVALRMKLEKAPPDQSIAHFLINNPDERKIVNRVQSLRGLDYHSPHADIMHKDFVPANITKLLNSTFHGLDKTVDAMDRVIRGVLFQGAPLPNEISEGTAALDWANPPRQGGAK